MTVDGHHQSGMGLRRRERRSAVGVLAKSRRIEEHWRVTDAPEVDRATREEAWSLNGVALCRRGRGDCYSCDTSGLAKRRIFVQKDVAEYREGQRQTSTSITLCALRQKSSRRSSGVVDSIERPPSHCGCKPGRQAVDGQDVIETQKMQIPRRAASRSIC